MERQTEYLGSRAEFEKKEAQRTAAIVKKGKRNMLKGAGILALSLSFTTLYGISGRSNFDNPTIRQHGELEERVSFLQNQVDNMIFVKRGREYKILIDYLDNERFERDYLEIFNELKSAKIEEKEFRESNPEIKSKINFEKSMPGAMAIGIFGAMIGLYMLYKGLDDALERLDYSNFRKRFPR